MKRWLAILGLNVLLALGLRALAPPEPVYSDRTVYEYLGERGWAPDCHADIFCPRVLVPVILEHVPLPSEQRWRWSEALVVIGAGFVLALATARAVTAKDAPLLATIVAQTSFGLTYTAYDPYTVDWAVYLVAALFAWAWLADRVDVAFVLASIGVFVKQTVVLIATAPAIAALISPRLPRRLAWLCQGVLAAGLLVAFYVVMARAANWPLTSGSPSANFLGGGWVGLWWRSLGPQLALFYTFAPFGLAWLYAAAGFLTAPPRLRALALGAVPAALVLVYVQTTERALGNFFFVVVPLAVAYLVRLPRPLALLAAVTNGLLTAKIGLSTVWLPSSGILLVPAALVCIWTFVMPHMMPTAANGMRKSSAGSR